MISAPPRGRLQRTQASKQVMENIYNANLERVLRDIAAVNGRVKRAGRRYGGRRAGKNDYKRTSPARYV